MQSATTNKDVRLITTAKIMVLGHDRLHTCSEQAFAYIDLSPQRLGLMRVYFLVDGIIGFVEKLYNSNV